MKIILASKSPRRKMLLDHLGYKFDVIPANIDESKISTKINPIYYCISLAKNKAESVSMIHPNALIIGADTIVVIKNKILNKPKDKSQAKKMLKMLSGNTHEVHTGVHLELKEKRIYHSFSETSKVQFNDISELEINYYIENHKPYDKAGSYGIQDWSAIFVEGIIGCYDNIVGLPISRLYKELKKLNINLLDSTLK